MSKKRRRRKPIGRIQRGKQYFTQKPYGLLYPSFLLDIEDRRRKEMTTVYTRPKDIYGREAEIVEQRRRDRITKSRLSFKNPHKVIVCIRRRIRRKELFERGKIGKGRRVSPIRKLTEYSRVRC